MPEPKRMIVKKPDTVVLTPGAANKFATSANPGRVINIDAETDGGGTPEIQLKHPDGSIEILARVSIPDLDKGERCSLRVRMCADIRPPSSVTEVE